MNFFFKKRAKNEEKETETIKTTEVVNEKSDVPTVIFDDLELQVKIGQWAEMLSSKKVSQYTGLSIYTHLDAEELIKKVTIPQELLDKVSKEFGSILERAGVDKDEVCTLSNHNKDNFSFNCHFEKANKDAKISLRWGDWLDNFPAITIQDDEKKEQYEYQPKYEDKPSKLILRNSILYNGENSLTRYLYAYDAIEILTNGNKTLKLDVTRPDSITELGYSGYHFRLKNEEELKDYLLSLSFPVDIAEVYKHIREIALGPIITYPSIKLVAQEKINDDESITTDEIHIKNGELYNFTRTKNGIKISIDKDDNWSYTSQKVSINKSSEGKVDYRLNADSYEELAASIGVDQFVPASEEVDKVKQFTKTLLKPKKQS